MSIFSKLFGKRKPTETARGGWQGTTGPVPTAASEGDKIVRKGPVFAASRSSYAVDKGPLQQRKVKAQYSTSFRSAPLVMEAAPAVQFRVVVMLFMLTLMFTAVGSRLAYVALMPPVEPRASIRDLPVEMSRRGNIYDRNGVLMAATLKVYSLYADPQKLLDRNEAVVKINQALPDLKIDWLKKELLDPDRRFVWLKRRLTPAEAQRVIALGLPGLEFRDEFVRVYPDQNLASHVLGAVDVDNTGLAGVERSYDKQLRAGKDLTLAIDVRAQDILRQSVREAVAHAQAKAGWGVVMDARTGELIALTSQPDFDPNHFGKANDDERFNRAALASYEMGSTFKLFTLAEGLASGKITPDSKIDCRFPIQIGRFTIKDEHAKKTFLTAEEVLRYSSNIGAAHIADLNGPEAQKDFMRKLGMLESLNVGLSEIGPVRYPSNWGRIQTFTIAFGHGIAVTPLHVVAAVRPLVTDGLFLVPHITKGPAPSSTEPPVVSETTIEQMRMLMRDVVANGSGRRAAVPGYDIGGKTGTAEKSSGGGYSHTKNIVSFVSAVPVVDPKYIVLVMLDEPIKQYALAAYSAAPYVGKFIQRYGLLTDLPPSMTLITQSLAAQEKANGGRPPAATPVMAPVDLNAVAAQADANGTAGND